MFNKKRQREAMANMMSNYRPTSKSALKSFCIMVAKGDVEEASKLYDFYIKDMEELPMFDPIPPTWIDNTKNAVTGLFDFVRENSDSIGQVVDIVKGVMGKGAAKVGAELPPIN